MTVRNVELLQVVGAIVGALVSALVTVEHRIVNRLRRAGAVSADRAVEVPGRRPVTRWSLGRLERAGVVRVLGSGAAFLDESAHSRLRRRRARVVVGALVVLLALLLTGRALG